MVDTRNEQILGNWKAVGAFVKWNQVQNWIKIDRER